MTTSAPLSGMRSLRLAAGLSIRELERRTGINRGRLSIIERGVVPTDEEARLILAALTNHKGSSEWTPATTT
jgi:transcriptional regulator with XRE-family HTH domain